MNRFVPFLLILFLGTSSVSAEEINKDFHQTFDVRLGTVLHLTHGDGDVKIKSWDRDVVDVKVRYRVEYQAIGIGGGRDFDVEFRQGKNDIYVIGRERGRSAFRLGFHSFRYIEYVYEITAPDYVELDLSGDDGEVEILGWRADISVKLDDGDLEMEDVETSDIRLRNQDGDIRLIDVKADLRLHTDDGDIYMRNLYSNDCLISGEDGEIRVQGGAGNLEIEMDDGDVDILDFQAERLRIHTADGDVSIELMDSPEFDLDVVTDDGRVFIGVEPGSSARFILQTDDGRMRVDVPDVRIDDDGRHRKTGEWNGGKSRIRIRTVDGDIQIREE